MSLSICEASLRHWRRDRGPYKAHPYLSEPLPRRTRKRGSLAAFLAMVGALR